MPDRKRLPISFYLSFAAALLWALLILWLSLAPHPPVSAVAILSWDKLRHAAAYALLTQLLGLTLASRSPSPSRPFAVAAIAACLFGALVEVLQGIGGAGRQAEWGDLLANAIGAAAVWVWNRRRIARSTSSRRGGRR